MIYTAYTDQTIFTDERQNAICDYLFQKLQEAFPPEVVDPDNLFLFDSFILSGKAAAMLRGDTGLIRNITFITDRQPIYDFLAQNVGRTIFKCNQISYKNRILFYPQPDLYFEIWLYDFELDPAASGAVKMQYAGDIPPQTL